MGLGDLVQGGPPYLVFEIEQKDELFILTMAICTICYIYPGTPDEENSERMATP